MFGQGPKGALSHVAFNVACDLKETSRTNITLLETWGHGRERRT